MVLDGEVRKQLSSLEREFYALRSRLAGMGASTEELPAEGRVTYLACRVGDDRAGLLLDTVEEVVPIAKLAALPEAPPWVAGLLNLRGESLPVLDVHARLTRARRRPLLEDLVVICRWNGRRVGLVVQAVDEVSETDVDAIQSPGDVPHAPYLLGVVRRDADLIVILSLDCLLSLSEIPGEEE